jgi:hypothetical protein
MRQRVSSVTLRLAMDSVNARRRKLPNRLCPPHIGETRDSILHHPTIDK